MDYYVVDSDDFIEKSRGAHKYIKRTGTPGNYRYWYRLPDGQIVEGNDVQQVAGKKDHLKRLVASKEAGHHSMEDSEIANLVGVPTHKVRWERSNLRQSARTTGGAGHSYERHHLDEARADPHHPSYERHVQAGVEHEASQAARSATAPGGRTRPASSSSGSGSRAPVHRGNERVPRGRQRREARAAAREAAPAQSAPAAEPARAAAPASSQPAAVDRDRQPGGRIFTSDSSEGAALRSAHRRNGNNPPINARGELATEAPAPAAAATPAAPSNADRIAKLRAKLAEKHGVRLGEEPEPAPAPAAAPVPSEAERARALSSRATAPTPAPVSEPSPAPAPVHHPESNPGTPHAAELSRSDPDFGASEAEIQRAVQAQQNGHNPYLHRAVEIFHRIRGDLKPERKQQIDHFFQAFDSVNARGERPTRENVLAAYKAIPGNERKRSLPTEDFERGTFHTMDEVFDNPPLNPEVERMKRGYAAKQFQRMKPFLKDAWRSSNPEAPPPMPTFGDLKSWTELGGPKPAWAGSTRIAVPEEVFNAVHKGPDGKPKYPPVWMPIHLMPVWNYIAKSMEREGSNPYELQAPTGDQLGSTSFGSQARFGEGMIISALRKYVQMRGGPDKLIDIPASKLSGAGLTHRDIFKSELTDSELKRLSTSKVIDPVGLMAVVKREMKAATKKSFELVVDLDAAYSPGETLRKAFMAEPLDLAKAMKIERIKGILRARGRA